MVRFLVLSVLFALPVMAAETQDRSMPVFGLDAGSVLRAFHLPDALVPGGRLLRIQFYPGYVARPWDETYVVESHEEGRPALLRHEVRAWSRKAMRVKEAGARDLTEPEVERIRQAMRVVKLCSVAADLPTFSDAPMVQVEFANESLYCFASRAPGQEGETGFGALLDLVRDLAGVEGSG